MTADDGPYLVFSFEHEAWWRPDERGYTTDIVQAGRYSKDRAAAICDNSRRDPMREDEVAVRECVAVAAVRIERERIRERAKDEYSAILIRPNRRGTG